MSADSQSRELLRQAILLALAPIPPDLGLGAPTLRLKAMAVGHDVTEAAIVNELIYLADKGLVTPIAKTLSPENRRWRLLAAGRDYLAEFGLG